MTAKPLRILVVEDHHDIRNGLVSHLASLGHWVESCPDAATALSRMSHDGLDVLLTDLWLPDAAGGGYLNELSRQGKLPPRVISMSADDDPAERARSRSYGCAGHLVTPVRTDELEAALR